MKKFLSGQKKRYIESIAMQVSHIWDGSVSRLCSLLLESMGFCEEQRKTLIAQPWNGLHQHLQFSLVELQILTETITSGNQAGPSGPEPFTSPWRP